MDFTAILMLAQAMGADTALLADVLPFIEPIIVASYREEGDHA